MMQSTLLQEFYRLPLPRALSSSSLDKMSNYNHVKLQTACVFGPLAAQKRVFRSRMHEEKTVNRFATFPLVIFIQQVIIPRSN